MNLRPTTCAVGEATDPLAVFSPAAAAASAKTPPLCSPTIATMPRGRRGVRYVVGVVTDRPDPEFVPVIGPVDIVVVALVSRDDARRVRPEALVEAWPAERRILDRLARATASITITTGAQ